MKKKSLHLTLLYALMNCSMIAAPIYTFEDGNMPGDSWNAEISIVDNPSKDDVNATAKCLKATFTETWGTIATFSYSPDYSKQGLTFLVYMDDQGEITANAYNASTEQNHAISAAVFEGKKWTRVSFDFSNYTSSSNSIQIRTNAKNTIYVDDIELIDLDKMQTSAFSCDGMDVPYNYGTLAIGGGGFVSGIIASGNSKYARTDVGGAYKWNANDCSWKPITNFISEDDKGLYSIEALAVDPDNEDNIYILAGCQYFSGAKTAVMCSKDGGKTFAIKDVSSLIRVHGNGDGRNCGERIAVDPNNSNIIFCGGRAGAVPLIKSEDGGETWSAISTFPASSFPTTTNWPSWDSYKVNTTPDNNGITSVVFDGTAKTGDKTSRVFVGVSSTNTKNIYVSEDGGSSWSTIDGLPTDLIPLRMKMDPDGNLLIAYANKCAYGSNGGVYRYNPTTKKATDISPANVSIGDIAVSPKDAKKLVASTNSTWIPQNWDNGTSANGDIVWTSTDGGETWRSLQNNMTMTNNGVTWIPGYALHWCGSVCMDPADDSKISFISGNGIFTCNNIFCEGTPTFYFDVNGLEETVPLDLVSIPNGDLLSVIGDYTGFIHKDIHQFAAIHNPAPGTSGGINYYSKDATVMMRVANTGFYYTTTGHDGWKSMSSTSYSYQNPYCGTCSALASNEGKCAITKKNGTYRFFVIPGPGESGIFYSDDDGSSWTKINGTDKATHIHVDPENDAYVYAGGKNYFYASSNYGDTFSGSEFTNGEYGRITIVPGYEGLIYAPAGGNGLKVSTDHGATWTSIPYVTMCEAVGCGKGLMEDSYVIYIWGKANGCAAGLYRSLDKGSSWQRINDETTQFGGPGNGAFVVGDWNTYGRFYMSSIGLGIIYGEMTENATNSSWNCFVDNTDCKKDDTHAPDYVSRKTAYPNPFDIGFEMEIEGDYWVSDIYGRIIENDSANGVVSLGKNWAKGIYFVYINGNVVKVIKK